MEGTLRKHIIDTDKQAKERFEILMKQILDKNPIDETLKDTDPLKWVGLMNNYKYSAEEIIFKELIYIQIFYLTFTNNCFIICKEFTEIGSGIMSKELIQTQMNVNNRQVRIMRVDNIDYISLTDLAKYQNENDPSGVIRNWMSNKNSFDFYNLWEELHNENFNSVESHRIKIDEVGYNRFTMTPNRWKKEFNAIGIIPSSGKYSVGTFAHPDIAFEFASWLNVEFKLYLITEFERLKQNESYQNKIEWSVRRELAKTNYRIHTDSIKENLVPTLTEKQKLYVYANEADILNYRVK